jgi:hypothetical protein
VWEACIVFAHVPTIQNHTSKSEEESGTHESFQAFVDDKAKTDNSWSFWEEFIFKNGLAFISLYISIRS